MLGRLARWLGRWMGRLLRPWPTPALAPVGGAGGRAMTRAPVAAPPRVRRRRWLVWRTGRFVTLLAGGALLLFVGLAALVAAGATVSFDLAVARAIQAVPLPLFGLLMVAVSVFGFLPQGFWLVTLTALGLWQTRQRWEAALALAGGLGGALAEGLKLLLLRPRPSAEQLRVAAELAGPSFPSGHTLMYVGFFGFLFYLAYVRLPAGGRRTLALGLCGGLVALVGISRVYLGQHWPTDVLASYLLGSAYLLLLVRVYVWRQQTPAAA
jgi:undecaprenyl-diphosphatase